MHLPLIVLAATMSAAPEELVVQGAKPAEEQRICRTERVTGSRVVKRICKTHVELQKEAIDAKNALRRGANTQIPEAFKSPTGQ